MLRPVTTSQPAAARPVPEKAGIAFGIRTAPPTSHELPKANEILLHVSPFAVDKPEPQTIRVNDQVTIIVRESKKVTSDSKVESKKDWTHQWELGQWLKLSDQNGIVPALFTNGKPAVKFDAKDDYGGDGKYNRNDELTTRIQATVIDVKPNGTLVLEATKGIDIDEEGYRITLTGTCRSLDVTPENTVLSTQIADMLVDVKHNGAVRDATRRGWLKRGVDFLRPF